MLGGSDCCVESSLAPIKTTTSAEHKVRDTAALRPENSLPSTSLPLLFLWWDQSFILHVVFFWGSEEGGKITASSKYNKRSRQRKVMSRRGYIKNNDARNTAAPDQAVSVWHMATGDAATNTSDKHKELRAHQKKTKKKEKKMQEESQKLSAPAFVSSLSSLT